jgi:hypothetical protein
MLCNRIDFKEDDMIFVSFDCFDIYKNDDISDPVGDSETLTAEIFDKLDFLSPTEFYNKYTDECKLLFNRVIELSNDSEKLEYWKNKIVELYKMILLTIPDFEYYGLAEIYNL